MKLLDMEGATKFESYLQAHNPKVARDMKQDFKELLINRTSELTLSIALYKELAQWCSKNEYSLRGLF